MKTRFVYPEGKSKALTMSYDDGVVADRRLVEIFNHYSDRTLRYDQNR